MNYILELLTLAIYIVPYHIRNAYADASCFLPTFKETHVKQIHTNTTSTP